MNKRETTAVMYAKRKTEKNSGWNICSFVPFVITDGSIKR